MNDQSWAVLIGAATVVVLRVIDFFFPKGRWYTWGGRTEKEEAEREAAADAKTDKDRRAQDKNTDTVRRRRHEAMEEEDD